MSQDVFVVSTDEPHRFVASHQKRVAVVLAGCGAKDGAEITEAVSLLIALSQAGYRVEMFAPDRPTHHVVNHCSGAVTQEERNILVEAARIARGNVRPLSELSVDLFDALAFSGGFGVAKNFCNYAFAGKDASLKEDIQDVLQRFVNSRKPIAALCIAPVLLALIARENKTSATVTLGDGSDGDAIAAVSTWGIRHQTCASHQACVDAKSKFVSAPAYMNKATPADIFASAQALVKGLGMLFS